MLSVTAPIAPSESEMRILVPKGQTEIHYLEQDGTHLVKVS